MKRIVVAFSYVNYADKRRRIAQENALRILASAPSYVFPVSFDFVGSPTSELLKELKIPSLNILMRDSSVTINNNRRLPYIKEILSLCYKVECEVFGYVNSDILIPSDVYDILQMDFDAYVFSRADIGEVTPEDFISKRIQIIYGGAIHSGADGFFFNKAWWDCNKKRFPDDLILGETEWDTCYRVIIHKSQCRYLQARALYHVYHDSKWDVNSRGGINNKRILEQLCQ